MHVGWAMVFDPLPGGGGPSVEQIRELLEERLDLLPRFRRRLSSPRVASFSWPTWDYLRSLNGRTVEVASGVVQRMVAALLSAS